MIDVDDQGVGDCPKRPATLGHVWKSWRDDPRRSCEFCGAPGRDNVADGESGGFFGRATARRRSVFDGLKVPMQNGTGDPAKAKRKGA